MQAPADAFVGAPNSVPALEIRHQRVDSSRCLIALAGEIDLASAPALKSALLALLADGYRKLVLDLSAVKHMDSTGLGVLVGFRRRLGDDEHVTLACLPPNVSNVLKVTGLDEHFEVFSSVEEALGDVPVTGLDERFEVFSSAEEVLGEVREPAGDDPRPLGDDAALVLGLAGTALPFAESRVGEAERWVRILSRYGDAARILRAASVRSELLASIAEDEGRPGSAIGSVDGRTARVLEHANRSAIDRGASEVGTVDLLSGVMAVYGSDLDRVLPA